MNFRLSFNPPISELIVQPGVILPKESMFGLFKKDPLKKMEKEHAKMLEEAMQIQRSGDIKGYAAKMAEADELEKKIMALREENK